MGLLDKLSKSGFEASQEQHSLPAQDKPIIQKKSNQKNTKRKKENTTEHHSNTKKKKTDYNINK